eukprot:gene1183-699_t
MLFVSVLLGMGGHVKATLLLRIVSKGRERGPPRRLD